MEWREKSSNTRDRYKAFRILIFNNENTICSMWKTGADLKTGMYFAEITQNKEREMAKSLNYKTISIYSKQPVLCRLFLFNKTGIAIKNHFDCEFWPYCPIFAAPNLYSQILFAFWRIVHWDKSDFKIKKR